MKTLPQDQDSMEAELAQYVRNQLDEDDESSIVSLEDRMSSFDNTAARETAVFLSQSLSELRPPSFRRCHGEEKDALLSVDEPKV